MARLSMSRVHLNLSLSDHHRPAHSSSAQLSSSLRFRSLPAAAYSAQHRYCSCRLIFHPPMFCCCCCLCPLRLYVCHCNTKPSPWWLLCLQWSVLPTTRTARAAIRVDRPTSCVCVMPHAMSVHLYVLITPMPRRSSAERRYEKSLSAARV